MADGLVLHDSSQQVQLVDESVNDSRASVSTGFLGIDSLLRRGGLLPGTFALLGGRTGTRKSTVMLNMAVQMVEAGHPVGVVGLDEPPWMYALKMISVWTGRSQEQLEREWNDDIGRRLREEYKDWARGRLHVLTGRRPDIPHLASELELASVGGQRPAVLFIDYLAYMTRDKTYGYQEQNRVPRLAEELSIWATQEQVTVIALHQLSRNDEYGNTNQRNAGNLPVTLAQLKYGGEEPADMVFGTYRPSMHPLALMQKDVAKMTLGDKFVEEEYFEARAVARRYEHTTFLQLLKNRPGVHREERGIALESSFGDSLKLAEKAGVEPVFTAAASEIAREKDPEETDESDPAYD